jgi:hypothetical protein
MRLINVKTMRIEEHMGSMMLDQYAILSHTWEDEEVTFGDFCNLDNAIKKRGFAKIRQTCAMAQEAGLSYAWVDTCCIDKTSSAELSEAINSMYSWYAGAKICYAYLSDLHRQAGAEPGDMVRELEGCRWFTRGWTLQELIAPTRIQFFDANWKLYGSKSDLKQALSTITRIDVEVLDDASSLQGIPAARRMAWAAKRKTTRIEDIAYSLLGIFDVNMYDMPKTLYKAIHT